MKKHLLAIAALILITNGLNAQDDRSVRFAFAIQPGTSWIAPEGESLSVEGNKFAFSYGILADIMIAGNPNYAFGTGVMVNTQGGTLGNTRFHDGDIEKAGMWANAEEQYALQYLDIPLTLKLRTNEIGYMTYYGQFGLDMSFNLRARRDLEYNYEGERALEIKDEDISELIVPIRMALQVGAGVEYNISGTTYLVGGIEWNNGITNVFDRRFIAEEDNGDPAFSENGELREGGKIKAINNYLGLTIGVIF
jgi:hypothetical protein